MTITIDTTRCIGCGMCAYAAPEVFRVVGKYSTVISQPEGRRDPKVSNAENGCPVNAISVMRGTWKENRDSKRVDHFRGPLFLLLCPRG